MLCKPQKFNIGTICNNWKLIDFFISSAGIIAKTRCYSYANFRANCLAILLHHNLKTYPATNISRYFFRCKAVVHEKQKLDLLSTKLLAFHDFFLQHVQAQHSMEPTNEIFLWYHVMMEESEIASNLSRKCATCAPTKLRDRAPLAVEKKFI